MSEFGTFIQDQFSEEFKEEPSFRMKMLEVYNWGPFQGKHCCEIDLDGSAIIGPTGSGKTTLVDGLMTLLALFPKYNLASTGGHESDRDLISYVRGVSGVGSVEDENNHVARPGQTKTGLAVTYVSEYEVITLGAILWVDSSSSAMEDLKRLWFFSKDFEGRLDQLLEMHHHEGGAKQVRRYARETTGLRVYDGKKDYLAQVRSFFEVAENAFTLLNRAAGLKQINSIDHIFRELVLDDRSMVHRAREVVEDFDTLQSIYQELEVARRQRDSLLPVQVYHSELEKILENLEHFRHLDKLLPVWFASIAADLWEREVRRIRDELEAISQQLDSLRADISTSEARAEALSKQYMKLGGAAIQGLEGTITARQDLKSRVQQDANAYQRFTRNLQLTDELCESAFSRNQDALASLEGATMKALEQARQHTNEAGAQLHDIRRHLQKLKEDIRDVRARPGSGVRPEYQAFREQLSQYLNLNAEDLPFVAELVEVKAEESHWRGAIERAIGSERLRILVTADRMGEALAWINGRDNRLHVRLQSADVEPAAGKLFDDGFVNKLRFSQHQFRANVKALLVRRDRHCVASTEELKHTEHGMTREGAMSDREGRFEKQDQRPLNEGWMTGFSNEHQLQEMLRQYQELQALASELESEEKNRSDAEEKHRERLTMINSLREINFSAIDIHPIEEELRGLKAQLDALSRPDSEAAQVRSDHKAELARLADAREHQAMVNRKFGSAETAFKQAKEAHQSAVARKGEGLNDQESAICIREFTAAVIQDAREVSAAEQDARQRLQDRINNAEGQKNETQQNLVRQMERAKKEDTGALTDTGTDLHDVPDYLDRLKILVEEALPEKLDRFRSYLNVSSGQGVNQLLKSIDSEVSIIEERVRDLNATLRRVDFRPGYYLELITEKTVHESLRQVETALRKLRSVVMNAADGDGDIQYRALEDVIKLIREAVEKKDNLGSRALLDPRHRLQFGVVEVDSSTGQKSGKRTGSQTGSGGEKEMMASYILTASLRYALSAPGAPRPRYATIVLDEAFSKSSPAAAARIIEALRIFGLHPLFVTPNKEIALLKAHTRSAIIVHNKNKRATLTSLSWQQIEARDRKLAVPVQ